MLVLDYEVADIPDQLGRIGDQHRHILQFGWPLHRRGVQYRYGTETQSCGSGSRTGGSHPNMTITNKNNIVRSSVAEPEPPGAATFRVEPEPIFLLAEAESRSRLFLRRLRLHLFGKQQRKALLL